MRLDGIHHITAITADAQRNLDFYVGLLGMRFVKKTVNFDMPEAYHLYYADEVGTPGSNLTFFEFPDAGPGRHGAGMIHRISWRLDPGSLDHWTVRLEEAGVKVEREPERLRFEDPEGIELELLAYTGEEPPLTAAADDIPPEHAIRGFAGVYSYTSSVEHSGHLLSDILGFERDGDQMMARGPERSSFYTYERAETRGIQGAGTVHHIAWASEDADHDKWHATVSRWVPSVTPVIDRIYFRSIYFREPSGVLFEIATKGPGFTIDESVEELGSDLRLPPQHEHLRSHLAETLTPLRDPRA